MRDPLSILTLGALGVLSFVVVKAGSQLTSLDAGLDALIRSRMESEKMQTLTETVTVGTRQIVVTTTKGDDETVDQFIARHNATVTALGS